MNIVIEPFDNDCIGKPFLVIRYFENAIKLSIEEYAGISGAFSVANMACFALADTQPKRYERFNQMLFYAGSIVSKIQNNGDCENICLDWLDFADFTVKVNYWLASH